MSLNDLSLEQLKAMAYDELRRMQVAQNNLNIIEKEIIEKNKPKKEESEA